jgi:hypothetical protein
MATYDRYRVTGVIGRIPNVDIPKKDVPNLARLGITGVSAPGYSQVHELVIVMLNADALPKDV